MALSRYETQITWSAAQSITLNTTTLTVSDAFPIDATTIAATVQVHADNQGTPASGDTLEIYIAYSAGDILGDTGNDFDTEEHASPLMVLDTYATNTPGEDPVRRSGPIAIAPTSARLVLKGNANIATRNIVVRARLVEKRSA